MTKTAKNIHFRELKSWRYCERPLTADFKRFAEDEIWPQLKELKQGRKVNEKKKITAHVVHNLVEAGLTGKVVADSRDVSKNYLRIQVWDAFVNNGLCKVCVGSEDSRKVSLYRATGHLLNLREIWELALLEDINLRRNTELAEPTRHALVVLYSGKTDWLTGQTLQDEEQKKPQSILKRIEDTAQRDKNDYRKPDPRAVQNGLNHIRAIENIINEINTENLSHSWLALRKVKRVDGDLIDTAFQPNILIRQVHSGKLFRGTRLYSFGGEAGQGMTKEQRQTIKIDGEKAAEVDAKAYHIRMLYHINRIDERGDCYWPNKIFSRYYSFKNATDEKREIVRDFVKKVTMIAINTSSPTSAVRAMAKALRDDKHKDFLTRTVFETENTDLNGILERLIKAHPEPVSRIFFTGEGLELMRIDGGIMLRVLKQFVVDQHKPALAIHDSLVVKACDVDTIKEIFTEEYLVSLNFKPVLTRVF
jgi:hypothetical protein